jgi:hypothetical protein
MNERIKDLYSQASLYACNQLGHVNEHAGKTLAEIATEKFAELIVEDCVKLMNVEKEYYSKPGTYESREYYERMAAKEDAFEDAASIIKNHFGVK